MNKLKLLGVSPDDEAGWSYGPNLVIYMDVGKGVFDKKKLSMSRWYWRMSDSANKDLFTIEMQENSGLIVMMELTAYSGILYRLPDSNTLLETIPGIPRLNTSMLRSELDAEQWPIVYDVPAKFKIQVNDERLRFELFPDPIKLGVLAGQKFLFEFNASDELCAITLNGFDIKCQENLLDEYQRRGHIRE